jgi:excisionase family DNA binding protein
MGIMLADKVYDTIDHLKHELHAAVTQHVGFVRYLEKNDFFPHLLTDSSYAETLAQLAVAVESVNDQLRKYSIFDSSLEHDTDHVDDLVGTVADRFIDWHYRKTMRVKDAAMYHNRSASTIYRWIKQGKLDATKVNGKWVVDPTIRDKKEDVLLQIAA